MRASLLVVVALPLLALAACNSNRPQTVTEESVAKLKRGMSFFEVQSILGSPTEDTTTGADRSCTWNGARQMVVVSFHNGQAQNIVAMERLKQPAP